NTTQPLVVRASYSDGTERDVTKLAVFISNNEVSAKVGEDGLVTAGQRGEAFIQARFAEYNIGAQVIVIPKNLPYAWPNNLSAANYIDEKVYAKLRKLRLAPSETCDDATFIRRVSIDLTGQLPTSDEVERFCAEQNSAKREALIDQLLAR